MPNDGIHLRAQALLGPYVRRAPVERQAGDFEAITQQLAREFHIPLHEARDRCHEAIEEANGRMHLLDNAGVSDA